MTDIKRVAVVGGAGSFGGRLVRSLLTTTNFHVIVCGRSAAKLQAFVDALPSRAHRVSIAALDRDKATAGDIAALNAFCVVDAAGPFQAQNLNFPRAVIEAGAHYVDLADARDFVAAFPTLDELAKARGVAAITGASSTPALSHAVLDEITRGWRRVDGVEIAISPGGGTSFGRSVIAAILSYVGRPLRVWRFGRWEHALGWGLTVRRAIGDIGKRWLSLCETPDLDLVVQRFPTVRHAIFRAGLERSVLHWGMGALGLLVRAGLMRSLTPLAGLMHWASELARRIGSDTGGMLVEARGVSEAGAPVHAVWTLIAHMGDGPEIPTLPALSVIRALADGRIAQPGAYACAGLVELGAIEREFKRFAIATTRETHKLEARPLFERMASGFALMPAAVRAAHAPDPACDLEGRVDIEGAANAFGRAIAWAFGFPSTASDQPASVTIEREDDGEIWIRRFGSAEFRSRLGTGRGPNRLLERFGAFTFELDIDANEKGFALSITGARLFGVPLPGALAPSTQAHAAADSDGRYRFDVRIDLPALGRLVGYSGVLTACQRAQE